MKDKVNLHLIFFCFCVLVGSGLVGGSIYWRSQLPDESPAQSSAAQPAHPSPEPLPKPKNQIGKYWTSRVSKVKRFRLAGWKCKPIHDKRYKYFCRLPGHTTKQIEQPVSPTIQSLKVKNVVFIARPVATPQATTTPQPKASLWTRVVSFFSGSAKPAPAAEAETTHDLGNGHNEMWSQCRYSRGLKFNRNGKLIHGGIDIGPPNVGDPKGSKVVNLQDGIVYKVRNQRRKAGIYLVIDHGDHFDYLMHLPEFPINPTTQKVWQEGEVIAAGTVITDSFGKTGNATNFILHFEVRLKNEKGKPSKKNVDPRRFHPELNALRR